MLEQAAAEQEDLDVGVVGECRRDRRAVGDDRGVRSRGSACGHGQRGGAPVEDHGAARLDQARPPPRRPAACCRSADVLPRRRSRRPRPATSAAPRRTPAGTTRRRRARADRAGRCPRTSRARRRGPWRRAVPSVRSRSSSKSRRCGGKHACFSLFLPTLHYRTAHDQAHAHPHRRPLPLRHRRRPRPDGRSNLGRLEEAAWPIFRSGHVPMIGEWVALPVLRCGRRRRRDRPSRASRCCTRPPSACSSTATPSCGCPASRPAPTRTSRSPRSAASPSTTDRQIPGCPEGTA